ncbi:N-acetylmuramoyl-L-alanine amidase [Paenibacillus sp. OV219]|uniref:N-acetylmuramoyl-L-alanine amidase n=1 Tax=Paenibacillus sp. OV219 TaxID=1884377 RepID=UPI0008C51511|nr:N-acetylmuramoyl-L-alanine amidase [Paenibacillus sp. OV219]SEM77729.1 N-acetylmuramoyl-L-alanine amidase [Paenibacillus sp. OV219]
MKKFVTAVLLLSFLISMFPALVGAAEAAPKLYLNGKQLQSGAEPQIVGDTTFVPIRTVTEGLGFDVSWTSPVVTISNGNTSMLLTIGDKTAIVNGQEASLEKPAIIDTGSTLVPLRFVGEQFGLQVYWDKQSRSVHLYAESTTPDAPVDPGTGSGSDNGTETGESGTPGSDPSTNEPNSTTLLKAIEYNGLGSISLPYDGSFGDVRTEVLHSPERIVIDLPNMNFAPGFTPGFTSIAAKLGEILIDSHPTLKKIRFSYYSDKPSTVRVVLDLSAPTNYDVVKEEQGIRIDVLEQTGPPPVDTPPVTDPTLPVTPPVVKPETPPVTGPTIYKVVLDAGHGGKDPGASSVNGHKEKEYNLAITLKVKALLDKETRIKPYLTRSNDTFIELDDRASFANNLKANLFISFHANKAESASVTGSETYYYHANSKAFADIIHKHLIAGTTLKNRSVRTAAFRVVKATTMPAVLLEAGYLSNSNDSSVLFSDQKQNKIAAEIVKGIKEYLKLS